VFIFPDKNDIVAKDTTICKAENTAYPISFSNSFKSYIDLYKISGVIPASGPDWLNGGNYTIDITTPGQQTLLDTIKIPVTAPKGYTCGDTIRFKLNISVVDKIGQLPTSHKSICITDSSDYTTKHPSVIFDRSIAGEYQPATIGAATPVSKIINGTTVYVKEFTFRYKECGTPIVYKTVKDTLFLLPQNLTASGRDWGRDTIISCRRPGPESIFTFYNDSIIDYPNGYGGKLDLNNGNSYWFDYGLTGKTPIQYGTISGGPSLHEGSYEVLVDSLKSTMGYNYLWKPDAGAFPCLVGADGKIDSGILVVIIQDEIVAQDYTAQLCKATYSGKKFSLAQYTGLPDGLTWTGSQINAPDKDSIVISALSEGTHKYTYDLKSTCGPGGKGVFYIKVGKTVKVSASKTVYYCVEKLPASINLNDVLNIAVNGLTWKVSGGGTIAGFNANTGILDIPAYSTINNPDGDEVLEFEIDQIPANSCVNSGVKLTLKFVNDVKNL
jgi:hypothetical protein